jgi:hypothetical protein
VAACGVEPAKVEVIPLGVAASFAEARGRRDSGTSRPSTVRTPYPERGAAERAKNSPPWPGRIPWRKRGSPAARARHRGKGHGSAGLVESVRKSSGGEVVFAARADDCPLYAGADVLVYPSLFEVPLPLSKPWPRSPCRLRPPALRETMERLAGRQPVSTRGDGGRDLRSGQGRRFGRKSSPERRCPGRNSPDPDRPPDA